MAKKSVRRLHVRDPYNAISAARGVTQATFSDVTDQFTNNPNVLYDPSKAPGTPKELSVASTRKSTSKPGKASRGHQKVAKRTLYNQNQGKTLKKR
jgi:hypothetical protein